MKKVALLSLALLLAPQVVEAQTTGGTVTATATVLSAITVSTVSDLDFGPLSGGAGASISPGNPPGGVQSLGELQITHNSGFSVDVTPPSDLTHTLYPAETISTSFTCGYATASGGGLDGAIEACGNMTDRTHAAGDGSPQTTYLQVGGNIANTTGAVPGVYTGTLSFTITAVY